MLEVRGEDPISSAALLGDPAEWLLVGTSASCSPLVSGDNFVHFSLFDADRTGVVDLQTEDPDLLVMTDDDSCWFGADVEDIGDRDGDGSPDLAVGHATVGARIHFFPEVTSGHVSDAPEVWFGAADYPVRGRSDLNGDGLDDALVSHTHADGATPGAGRVYLVPWSGPGEFLLDADAPARVMGELTEEETGEAVACGDLDGDGQDDLAVSAPSMPDFFDAPGRVTVFLGPIEGVLTREQADGVWVGATGDRAGESLAVGDFDGSGHADLAIGAPYADGDVGPNVGAVYLLSDPF